MTPQPRRVRNFWLRAYAQDHDNSVSTGPTAADQGMDVELFQRSAGEAVNVADILCRWLDGSLTTTIRPNRRAAPAWVEMPDGSILDLPIGATVVITTAR